jgi:deoxyribonuclease-1
VDFKRRTVEPPDFAKKRIADAYFYMHKTYGLKLSKKQQQLFTTWQKYIPYD